MKSIKIDIPKGYEIDKEKSTFENIVFKKVDDAIIKWSRNFSGVEIKADGEHFIVSAGSPSFYCCWYDAIRYYTRPYCILKLPTVKQLQIIAKHIDKINEVIRSNDGFEISGWMWSCQEKSELGAWLVHMNYGYTNVSVKGYHNYVRSVYNF